MCVKQPNKTRLIAKGKDIATFLLNHFYFLCMSVLYTCMLVHHLGFWCVHEPELGVESLELELQMAVSHQVDGGNQSWVL